jgi:hypothetical protein
MLKDAGRLKKDQVPAPTPEEETDDAPAGNA